MKVSTSIALFAVTLGSLTSNAQLLTGPITNPSNGHEYYLTAQTNWTGAQAIALTLGGDLATIRNAAENSWVFSTFSDYGGQPRQLWIGLTTGAADGSVLANYFWADGETSSYRNFAPSEPNFPEEHYVCMIGPGVSVSGQWNNGPDVDLGGYTGFGESLPAMPFSGVVEVVPEPAGGTLVSLGAFGYFVACRVRRRPVSLFA